MVTHTQGIINHLFIIIYYDCESGTNGYYDWVIFPNDPIWNGEDCPGGEATCCTSPKMARFFKMLNETVNDSIELSIRGLNATQGTPLDLVKHYIK